MFKLVIEPSDNDPVYVVRFKIVFTTDLAKWKDTTNVTWLKIATALDPRFKDLKCLPKDEKSETWASLHNLMMAEMPAPQPSPEATEMQPPKKRRMTVFLMGSSDTDTDKVEESIEQCLKSQAQNGYGGVSTTAVVKERRSTCEAGTHCTQIPVNPCNHSAL
ncbi:hypothetical protein AOLI_G00037510 [Acnodon oligacanthus]